MAKTFSSSKNCFITKALFPPLSMSQYLATVTYVQYLIQLLIESRTFKLQVFAISELYDCELLKCYIAALNASGFTGTGSILSRSMPRPRPSNMKAFAKHCITVPDVANHPHPHHHHHYQVFPLDLQNITKHCKHCKTHLFCCLSLSAGGIERSTRSTVLFRTYTYMSVMDMDSHHGFRIFIRQYLGY